MRPPSLTARALDGGGPQRAGASTAELAARYGAAAIVLALPLEFTAMFMFQPLVRWLFVIMGGTLVYLLATRRWRLTIPRQPSVLVLLVLVALALASWAVARPSGSYRQIVDVLTYPVASLVIMNLARTDADHRRAWTAFLISGLGVAALGVALYAAHVAIWTPNPVVAHRLNITFADPNITARFLTLCAVAAVMLFAARRSARWLAGTSAVACALVIPMTWSRSGLVLFPLSLVLAVVMSVDRRRAITIGVCALITFAVSTGVNPDTRQRAAGAANTFITMTMGTAHSTSSPPASTSSAHDTFALEDNRRYLIAAGLKMFRDHPLTGVGFGGYQQALVTTYRQFLPTNDPNPDTVSHTSFVTTLAEEGIVGVLILLAFLIQLGREVLRFGRSPWTTIPATLIVPIFLYSQFEGRFLEEPYLWLCVGLTYSAMLLESRAAARAGLDTPDQNRVDDRARRRQTA